MIMLALNASTVAYSQERDTVSVAELRRIHGTVKELADNIAKQRQEMDSDQSVKLFFRNVVESQKSLEPVIVLIAETDAPKEAQLYAISVAIAVKEIELALWHYLNAFMSNQQKYLSSADVFLHESLEELSRATSLSPGAE